MDAQTLLPILKKIPLFAELTEAEHADIIKNIVLNYYPTGHVFFKEGDGVSDQSSMYIIKHGMIKISREEKEVAVLADNDFFGEMAFVCEDSRNATATAMQETEIFELKKEFFMKLLQTNPSTAARISDEFIHRIKQNDKSAY